MDVHGDQAYHLPSGSNVPGKVDANPYVFYPPDDLRKLLETIKDPEELKKIVSALKQWERQYQYPTYPWRKTADFLRSMAYKLAEIQGPAQNLNQYQDLEVPDGFESILEPLISPYDNDNNKRFINNPKERSERDLDFLIGDFSAPKEPLFDAVEPRGDGPDPEGMEVPFPPTGGNIDGEPQGI
jgi:hypothetical protein